MKKLLALAGILCLLTLTGCTVAKADGEEKGEILVTEVDLQDGYYLSNNDDSYIHIEDGMIELCGYDIEGKARENWENTEGKKVGLEEWTENAYGTFEPLFAWKEYTPVRFVKMGEGDKDLVVLVVDYEFASEKGAYTGYVVNDDGTISREGNIYTYGGETLNG